MTEYSANYCNPPVSAPEYYAPVTYGTYSSLASQTNSAKWTYQRLAKSVRNLEATLDEEHEIGVRLLSPNASLSFHLQDLSYYDPSMLIFHGKNDQGEELQLIQHVSQLSVVFVSVKKHDKKPVRIGNKLLRPGEKQRTL